MKLLVSAYACIPHRGSEPGHGWNWTLENAKLGYSVWCFTTPEGREVITKEMKNYPALDITFIYIDVPRWVNYMYRFQPFVYFHYLYWQRKAAREAQRLDKKVNFDAILHASMESFQLGSGMWRLNKPFIFGPVGGGSFPPRAFKDYFYGEWRTEIIRRWTSNLLLLFNRNIRALSKKALIIVANTDTRKMAEEAGATRIVSYLDVGLPKSFFPAEIPQRNNDEVLRLLWVGRIFPRKGLPLVLEALSKVRDDVPFQLTIIGDGSHGHLVPGLLQQYGLEAKATWRGQVPWEDVRRAYLDHHAFIFCSLRDTFGAQYLEAMAYALPIISLNHQGAGDHIPDDAGIKVPVATPEETTKGIAHAVEYLFDHPEERTRFGIRGFEFSNNHNWEAKARWMSQLFPSILRKEDTPQNDGPSDPSR
jgi:glycosyltransferase involved in cell wall biosynthesis